MTTSYEYMHVEGGAPVKMWTRGVPVDDKARDQLARAAQMPFIFKHVAAMPDVHVGIGATVGSVIPTKGAVIPAAVGRRYRLRHDGGAHLADGAATCPTIWRAFAPRSSRRCRIGRRCRPRQARHRRVGRAAGADRRGLGDSGRALRPDRREISEARRRRTTSSISARSAPATTSSSCLDTEQRVWVMLHSGSRGVGNAIGSFFIELAKQDMRKWFINLPDENLAYFPEGTEHFDDYVEAVGWAQDFAALNRRMMMTNVIRRPARRHRQAVRRGAGSGQLPPQLCDAGEPFRRERARHPQGRGARGEGRDGHHPGLDGREIVHRARPRQRGIVRQLQPRRGARDVPHPGQEGGDARRAYRRHGRRRMPQGRRRDRRDARGPTSRSRR